MFEITRGDGRSNQQVLIDSVRDAKPGTLFTYDELKRILDLSKNRTRAVVLAAQHRLLKEYGRTLENVRGEGYRMAEATDHTRIAHGRKRRADVQLRKGLHVLRHVRWEELDEEASKAHQGTLMITEALYRIQASQDQRLSRIEAAIQKAGLD